MSDSQSVDDTNSDFYGSVPLYPPPPRTFPKLEDADFDDGHAQSGARGLHAPHRPVEWQDLGSRLRHEPGRLHGASISKGRRRRIGYLGPLRSRCAGNRHRT